MVQQGYPNIYHFVFKVALPSHGMSWNISHNIVIPIEPCYGYEECYDSLDKLFI